MAHRFQMITATDHLSIPLGSRPWLQAIQPDRRSSDPEHQDGEYSRAAEANKGRGEASKSFMVARHDG